MRRRKVCVMAALVMTAVLLAVGLWLALREGNKPTETTDIEAMETQISMSSVSEAEGNQHEQERSEEVTGLTASEESEVQEKTEEISEEVPTETAGPQEEEPPFEPSASPLPTVTPTAAAAPISSSTPTPAATVIPTATPAPMLSPTPSATQTPSATPVPEQHEHTYEKIYWYGTPSCATANNYYNLICSGCGENGGDGEDVVPHTPKSASYESVDGCRIYRIVEAVCEICGADLGREETFLREEHDWITGMSDSIWNEALQDFVSREITYCAKCYREK